MVYTKNLVAVCAGRDAVRAAEKGMQVLHLCLGLSENGALERRQLPAMQLGCFLGLCDPPRGLRLCNPERLASDLVFEAKRVNAPGVFADFERETAQTLALLHAFDEALAEEGIPLYVPVNIGRDLDHAVLTVSTALSGGSLTAYFSSLQGIYGAHRVAAFLAGLAGLYPALVLAGRKAALRRRTGGAARRDRCAGIFLARAVRAVLHLHRPRGRGALCAVRRRGYARGEARAAGRLRRADCFRAVSGRGRTYSVVMAAVCARTRPMRSAGAHST